MFLYVGHRFFVSPFANKKVMLPSSLIFKQKKEGTNSFTPLQSMISVITYRYLDTYNIFNLVFYRKTMIYLVKPF